MPSLSFADVNIWLAILMADHVHRSIAAAWWESTDAETIGFCRSTQMSVLRLLTTAAAMNGKPLTMARAWKAYDRLFEDYRVAFLPEPSAVELEFRRQTESASASPKSWADAYLIAFSVITGATLVTFDRALEHRTQNCLVLR